MTVPAGTAAVILALALAVVLLGMAAWRRERRHRVELADCDASYRALLEINVRHYRDIAERDARYRVLFENNPQPMWAFDEKTLRFLAVNEAACRHYGYSQEEFLAMTLADIRPPEDVPVLLETLAVQDFTHGSVGVWRHRKKDGTLINVDINAHSLTFGGVAARLVVVQDVTERQRAAQALARSEAKYRSIFDFATLGIYQSRRDGSFVTANSTLAAMLGYDSSEELVSKSLYDIYADPEERRKLVEQYGQDGQEATARGLELLWKKKDGSEIWIELHFHAYKGTGESGQYFEGFVHDITQRKKSEEEKQRLEEQLLQSQKMEAVGQLAGGIAHDFNNLLTAIAGYSELLLGELPVEDTRRGHAEEIRRAGERAASLTRQLLAFSRRQTLEQEVFDLNEVVGGIEPMVGRLLGEQIEMRTSKASDLWKIKADPGQIEQAIVNLALNARDAMPDGGKLTIETGNVWLDDSGSPDQDPVKPGPYALIAITDTGIGMTSDVKAHLYEPFFTTKERGKGTGLGLSTTYGIIKQSGGHIGCETEPGRGTKFKIYLPRAEEAAEPEPAPAPALHPGSETVLLVEDEPEVRALVQRILKSRGYTVVTAANPDEALAVSREYRGRIQIMVTDVVMPGMSGRQLAERLALSRPEMRVLFVSGYTDDAVFQHGLDGGAAFLQKPFTPSSLARKVREVLESSPT